MRRGGALLLLAALAYAHECGDDVVVTTEEDWMEAEVVAGFRVWQILFLVVAGLGTLVVSCCCVTRCRVPRTRQEIEANHRRNQITQLFRAHLDTMVVDEVDLMWALDEVKVSASNPCPSPPPPLSLVESVRGRLKSIWGRRKEESSSTDQEPLQH